MPVQSLDPPFIDSVAAQAYRATLRKIYKAPSAIPLTTLEPQLALPPVPYVNTPEFKPFIDTQIKNAPPLPTAPPQPFSVPQTPTPPPPTTNPVPRFAPPPGSGGATVVTTTAGGVITRVGGLVTRGGLTQALVAVAAEVLIHDAKELYKLFKLSQPESKPIPQSLRGGQEKLRYLISGTITEIVSATSDFGNSTEITWHFDRAGGAGFSSSDPSIEGPIQLLNQIGDLSGGHSAMSAVFKTPQYDHLIVESFIAEIDGVKPASRSKANSPYCKITSINLVAIPQGQTAEPESQSKPLQKRPPIKSGISPTSTPQGISSPSPTGVRSPTSPPPALDPLPTNNRIPYTITTPGSNPITITSPGAAPVVISPTGTPATIKITRPSASPFLSPTPASTPRATPVTTPIGDPVTTPVGVPITVSSPGTTPTELVMPGANPITINYPGQEPIIFDPSSTKPPQGVQAVPIPKPGAFITTAPVKPTQTPTNPVISPTKPGTPTAPTIPGVEEPDVKDILLKLVALTGLIQGVNKNTTPTAIQNAVAPAIAPAVCSTTAPGGCSSNMTNNAVGKGVDDLKDFLKKNGVDALAQAEQLRLLNRLDNKMGAQMPGGVAGAFGRLSSFLGVDRIFNLINFMANLHNAFMLSNSLKVTLLEMLSSIGNATGLLQSSEGENVDLNEVYNKGVRALINSVLGDEQAARLEIQFRKANRIYQAATNSLNAVSSMMSSLGNVVETGAEYGGKIGNALKAAGAVHEKAYQWMAEKFDAKVSPFMKYSQTVNGVNTALETINEIAESVVEGQQAATDFQKANKDFLTAVAEVKKNPGIENKAVAAEVALQKENATKDPTGEDETGLLSFLTDL